MKNLHFILGLFLFLQACAFNGDKNVNSKESQYGGFVAKFDWNNGINPKPDYLVKAKRFQNYISAKEVSSDTVVTLPVKIPNPLTIITDAPANVINGLKFARAYSVSKGEQKQLTVEVAVIDGLIRFNVESLASVFSQSESQSLKLKVEVFGETEKLFTFNYLLRTPPTNIVPLSYDLFTAKDSVLTNLTTGMMAPEIEGQYFALVRIISLENQEDNPVEVSYLRKLQGVLFQDYFKGHYQEYGCPSNSPLGGKEFQVGHNFDFKKSTVIISKNVYVSPIDENTLVNLGVSKKSTTNDVTSSYLIPPKSTVYFGVYATGNELNQWVQRGGDASFPDLQNQNTDCYRYCDSGERGHSICTAWYRKQSTFNMGESFENSILSLNDQKWSVRFIDQDQLKEDGYREKVILQGSFPVTFKKFEI